MEAIRKFCKDPEYRKRLSVAKKKACANPEFSKRMSDINHNRSSEWRERNSDAVKKRWQDKEFKKHMSEVQKKDYSERPHNSLRKIDAMQAHLEIHGYDQTILDVSIAAVEVARCVGKIRVRGKRKARGKVFQGIKMLLHALKVNGVRKEAA